MTAPADFEAFFRHEQPKLVALGMAMSARGPDQGLPRVGQDPRVFRYAVGLDWAPVPQVVDLGDGRLLSIRTEGVDLQPVIASLQNAPS